MTSAGLLFIWGAEPLARNPPKIGKDLGGMRASRPIQTKF